MFLGHHQTSEVISYYLYFQLSKCVILGYAYNVQGVLELLSRRWKFFNSNSEPKQQLVEKL